MVVKVTDVTEEYLEAIYRLQQLSGVARTSEIVKMLHVVPGTVTNTMKRLQRDGLITHKPYRGVKLTERGLRIALDVIRRHRLSERLLTDILKVEWAEAHEAACGIEHGLTEDITSNLERVLGHPTTCPHGNPIPTKSGEIIEGESKALTHLNPQEKGIIEKIEQEESDILRYLNTLNLKPGTLVKVIEKAPFNGPITIAVDGKTLALGQYITTKIRIRKE